jgi:hypothetical protein
MMDVGQVLGPIISGVILASFLQYNGLFLSLTVVLAVSAAVFFLSGIAKAREAENKKGVLPNSSS